MNTNGPIVAGEMTLQIMVIIKGIKNIPIVISEARFQVKLFISVLSYNAANTGARSASERSESALPCYISL
jgi:hypothetical protein